MLDLLDIFSPPPPSPAKKKSAPQHPQHPEQIAQAVSQRRLGPIDFERGFGTLGSKNPSNIPLWTAFSAMTFDVVVLGATGFTGKLACAPRAEFNLEPTAIL